MKDNIQQLQLLFLHNEAMICQFHKLAWGGLAVPVSDEGQQPCLKQIQLLFLYNEGTVYQFHKLAWAGLAVPIIDEGQYPWMFKAAEVTLSP